MIEKIGNLRIISELGRGGMGVVYLAEHMIMDKKFAVKGLSVKYTDDPNVRQLLQRLYMEGKKQALLDHPNIVQITDLFDEQGQCFLVMEYVEGEDLAQLIKRKGSLLEKEALTIIKEILAGLGFAHRKGMIHRDIKPSNVMVGNDGRVRIMDFGLSIVAGEARLTIHGSESGLTPWYASPEQIETPQKIDHRSDVYSLGIVLFEMLTGQVPFDGEPYSVTHQQVNAPLPDPTKVNPGISKGLARIILKCVEKNPDKRFQGCDDLLKAILAYEKSKALPRKMGLKPWLFAAATIVLACAVMVIFKNGSFSESASDPEVVRQAVAALVQSSVGDTTILCYHLKRLPKLKGNLRIAEKSGLNNLKLVSEIMKNIENIEADINIRIKEFNDIIKQLRGHPRDIVAEEVDRYLNAESEPKKKRYAGYFLSYFDTDQIEINTDEFKSMFCSE